jgi:hypothetical protein
MKKLPVTILVALVTMLSARNARAFGIGADVGYSRLLGDHGQDGYGGDLYLRLLPIPLPLIDLELQGGYHRFEARGMTAALVPVFIGARLNLPIPVLNLFVGARVGLMHRTADLTFTAGAATGGSNDFAFNVGGGINLVDLPLLKLGVASWYYVVTDHASTKMLTVGLNVDVGF